MAKEENGTLNIEEVLQPFDWENDTEGNEGDKKTEKNDEPDGDKDDEGKKKNSKSKEDKSNVEGDDDSDKGNEGDSEGEEGDDDKEKDLTESFFDALSEKLGIDSSDMGDDFKKPTNPDELLDFFDNIITENSKPTYSDKKVEDLDKFMKNGGNFEDFYRVQQEASAYEGVDLEDEGNQRQIIYDYLEDAGYDNNQISRKIKKYTETGLLKDEAEDALESLKKTSKKREEKMLKDKEDERRRYEEEQKKMFDDSIDIIKKSDSISGYKLSNKDKKELAEYIFKPQKNGRTKWQDDYGKSVKNMITSAFFTMKGDSIFDSARKTGETDAVKKFKEKLASNKIKGSKVAQKAGSLEDFVSAFGL